MKPFPDVGALTRELVRIPSVNPSGDPGTEQVGEAKIAQVVGDYLETLGAVSELREVLPGRPNVVGRFPNPNSEKILLFAPHLDTVSVKGMTIDPFGGELRDGKIFGRGATDTKGTMAAMLCALAECRDVLDKLKMEIWFAGLMSEEAGNDGAIALANEMQPDFVIAGEPTQLGIVHTHKGAAWIDLVSHGVAVHGSTPHLGENAIYQMTDVISYLRDELIPELKTTTDHPVLGPITINVGMIQGGSKVNIVPDRCRIELDCRIVPGHEDFPAKLTQKINSKFPKVEVLPKRQTCTLDTKIDHPMITQLQKLGSPLIGAPWFCDAAIFAQKGVPAIALGPGSIAQAHTEDEWVKIEDLEAGVRFFSSFLRSLL